MNESKPKNFAKKLVKFAAEKRKCDKAQKYPWSPSYSSYFEFPVHITVFRTTLFFCSFVLCLSSRVFPGYPFAIKAIVRLYGLPMFLDRAAPFKLQNAIRLFVLKTDTEKLSFRLSSPPCSIPNSEAS